MKCECCELPILSEKDMDIYTCSKDPSYKEFYHVKCSMVDEGLLLICDRCHVEVYLDDEEYSQSIDDIKESWRQLFYKRPTPWPHDLCLDCCKHLDKWMLKLRDADELNLYVNDLERVIRYVKLGKRDKDYRTIKGAISRHNQVDAKRDLRH